MERGREGRKEGGREGRKLRKDGKEKREGERRREEKEGREEREEERNEQQQQKNICLYILALLDPAVTMIDYFKLGRWTGRLFSHHLGHLLTG